MFRDHCFQEFGPYMWPGGPVQKPIPPQCLAPIDFLKIPAQILIQQRNSRFCNTRGKTVLSTAECYIKIENSDQSRDSRTHWRETNRILATTETVKLKLLQQDGQESFCNKIGKAALATATLYILRQNVIRVEKSGAHIWETKGISATTVQYSSCNIKDN